MGKHDSSKTRVVPILNTLMDRDATGNSWLPRLCQFGSRAAECIRSTIVGTLPDGHPRWWGENERRLDPPKALLQWLVYNVEKPASDTLWGGPATRSKREALVARDSKTIAEAVRLLDESCKGPAWYILEGRSQPDAYFETASMILVIEGKRTEREATSTTTWMSGRSQMLRHMDAAWEIRNDKRVLGLMITEGPGGADALAPSNHWLDQANLVISEQMLPSSLPHRTAAERQEIADGFLGVTTWQRICADLGIHWPPDADPRLKLGSK